jgi:hypothetical protein
VAALGGLFLFPQAVPFPLQIGDGFSMKADPGVKADSRNESPGGGKNQAQEEKEEGP